MKSITKKLKVCKAAVVLLDNTTQEITKDVFYVPVSSEKTKVNKAFEKIANANNFTLLHVVSKTVNIEVREMDVADFLKYSRIVTSPAEAPAEAPAEGAAEAPAEAPAEGAAEGAGDVGCV